MDRLEEIEHKLGTVRRWLDDHALHAVLFGSQDWFAWLTAGGRGYVSTGEQGGVASILVSRDDAFLLTTNIELERLLDEEVPRALPFVPVERPWHEVVDDGDLVRDLVDPAGAVSDMAANGLAPAPSDLVDLRFTLLEPEIERYRALGRDAAEAVESVCRSVGRGDPEHDVASALAEEAVRRGIVALVDLVAADDRIGAYRHPLPTDRGVQRTLLVALTGRRHGLHASLTRMVSFGPPDDDLVARHDAVTRVDATELLTSRPGVTLGEVFAAAAARYEAEGFPGEWRSHHQGGLTGYAGREIFATASSTHRLEVGQALAWNPSITRVKSEDTVVVAERGPEILTATHEWPQRGVAVDAGAIDRPAILVVS
jgi:Xaa-Pro aminopeptidase